MNKTEFLDILVDTYNYGLCDKCKFILPIERGDNFFWIEKKKIWVCKNCYEKIIGGKNGNNNIKNKV